MYNPFANIKIEIFGESHGEQIGVNVSGFPVGEVVDFDELETFLQRRKSNGMNGSTPRKEPDQPIFINGINGNEICGDITVIIKNVMHNSSDYENVKYKPRPSHADYVCAVKDGTGECPRGGGRFSGRLTAPLCIAGGIAKQILAKRGISVLSYVRSIGKVVGDNYDDSEVTIERINNISTPIRSLSKADEMSIEIVNASRDFDSVGGVIDVVIFGLGVGYGDNLFNGLEGRISQSVFGVPAIKGVSFGLGFEMAKRLGSEVNDEFYFDGDTVKTYTNNSGGINGGISNGMPITLSCAFRPTPSIFKEQRTVDLKQKINTTIQIVGRHDSCIAVRGGAAVEAAVALAVLDVVLDKK